MQSDVDDSPHFDRFFLVGSVLLIYRIVKLKDIGNRFFYSLYLLHIRTEYLITYFDLSIAFSCLEIS